MDPDNLDRLIAIIDLLDRFKTRMAQVATRRASYMGSDKSATAAESTESLLHRHVGGSSVELEGFGAWELERLPTVVETNRLATLTTMLSSGRSMAFMAVSNHGAATTRSKSVSGKSMFASSRFDITPSSSASSFDPKGELKKQFQRSLSRAMIRSVSRSGVEQNKILTKSKKVVEMDLESDEYDSDSAPARKAFVAHKMDTGLSDPEVIEHAEEEPRRTSLPKGKRPSVMFAPSPERRVRELLKPASLQRPPTDKITTTSWKSSSTSTPSSRSSFSSADLRTRRSSLKMKGIEFGGENGGEYQRKLLEDLGEDNVLKLAATSTDVLEQLFDKVTDYIKTDLGKLLDMIQESTQAAELKLQHTQKNLSQAVSKADAQEDEITVFVKKLSELKEVQNDRNQLTRVLKKSQEELETTKNRLAKVEKDAQIQETNVAKAQQDHSDEITRLRKIIENHGVEEVLEPEQLTGIISLPISTVSDDTPSHDATSRKTYIDSTAMKPPQAEEEKSVSNLWTTPDIAFVLSDNLRTELRSDLFAELELRLREFQHRAQSQATMIPQLEDIIKELNNRLSEEEKLRSELKKQIEELEGRPVPEDLTGMLHQVELMNKKLQQELHELKVSQTATVEDLQSQIKLLTAQFEKQKIELLSEHAVLIRNSEVSWVLKYSDLQTSYDALQAVTENLERQISELWAMAENKASEHDQIITKAEHTIQELKSSLVKMETLNDSLSVRNNNFSNEVLMLKTEFSTRKDNYEAQREQLQNELEATTLRLDTTNQSYNAALSNLKTLELSASSLDSLLAIRTNERDNLTEQLHRLQEELQMMRQQHLLLQSATGTTDEEAAAAAAAKNVVDELHARLSKQTSQISKLEKDLAIQIEISLEDKKLALEEFNRETNRLQQEMKLLKMTIKEKEIQMTSLIDQCQELKNAVASLQQKLLPGGHPELLQDEVGFLRAELEREQELSKTQLFVLSEKLQKCESTNESLGRELEDTRNDAVSQREIFIRQLQLDHSAQLEEQAIHFESQILELGRELDCLKQLLSSVEGEVPALKKHVDELQHELKSLRGSEPLNADELQIMRNHVARMLEMHAKEKASAKSDQNIMLSKNIELRNRNLRLTALLNTFNERLKKFRLAMRPSQNNCYKLLALCCDKQTSTSSLSDMDSIIQAELAQNNPLAPPLPTSMRCSFLPPQLRSTISGAPSLRYH